MDIKEIAEESGAIAYSPAPLRAVRGYSFTFEQLQNFSKTLIAEIAKGNEPVARLLHRKARSLQDSCRTVARTYEECHKDAYPDDWTEGDLLYALPPTAASQIEQETAEACARVYLNTYDLTDIADDIRSGAWKEFK